jgi:EmrB/QacA subfamily drug resistance transporter
LEHTETSVIEAAPRDYSRKWLVLSAVAMGIFLATIDGSIVNVALPTLSTALAADFATVQWVVLSYLLTITTLLAVVGRLADMYGRKRLYNSGFVVFTLGSLLCGLAPSVGWLIGFRVLQGVGAALILALGLALVTEAFPPEERGRALGIAGSIVSIGIVTGPTLGGVIIENLSWHWIFFVNVPIGILGTYLVWRNIPVTRPPGGQTFDFGGAATLCLGLLGLLLGLTTGQQEGFTSPQALGLFAFGIFFLLALVYIQRRHPQPIIDPTLFRNRLFTVNLFTGLLVFVGLGSGVLIPFYLETVLGYNVQQVGLLLAVVPIALGIVSPISGVLSDRVGSRPISALGLAVTLLGYLALSTLSTETTAVGFMWRYALVGVGIGLFQSPNNSAMMGTAPRERLGVASSLLAMTRNLGQTVGIAVLGALWAALVFGAAGGPVAGGATAAPAAAQAAGLAGVSRIVAGLIGVALLVALWAWWGERVAKPGQSTAP